MADYTIPNMDNTVALGIKPPAQQEYNPLATASGLTELQTRMNQLNLFKQQMAARSRAGQIMAGASNNDDAMAQMSRDPLVSGFMPEMLNTIRQLDLTNAQLQGVRQTQGDTAIHALMQTIPSAMTDLGSFDNMMASRIATLPPDIQKQIKPSLGYIRSALFDGLPKDPQQAQQAYRQRVNALMIGGGFSPEQIAGLTGTTDILKAGGYQQGIVRQPSILGGGISATTPPIPMTLAPTTAAAFGPGGAPSTVIIGGGMPGQGALPYTPLGGNPITSGGGAQPPATGGRGTAPAPARGNALTGTSAPRGGGISLTGLPLSEQEAQRQVGQKVGDIQSDMIADGRALPAALKRVDMMTDTLKQFQAGGGAMTRASIAKGLQAMKNAGMNISQETIDGVGNSNLSATQLFEKEVKPLVISELKDSAQGTGRVMRSEVDAFLAMMDASTDPVALMKMLNQSRYSLQVGYDRAKRWPEFKSGVEGGKIKNFDKSDFYTWYNSQMSPEELPGKTGGGMSLAPVPESSAKGVPGNRSTGGGPSAKVTHQYIPGRGIVPVGGR